MEIIFFIFAIILGIVLGTLTGLIPSLHTNLIAIIFLSFYLHLNLNLSTEIFSLFIISLTITHTFLNFIPTTIFGIADSSNSLVSFPAHQLTLIGEGFSAIKYSAFGSLIGGIFSIIISIFLFFILQTFYNFFTFIIPYFLLFILIFFIFLEKNISGKFWALIIIIFGGILGVLTLNSNHINQPLLILFSGTFGCAIIINSLIHKLKKLPKQKFTKIKILKKDFKNSFIGTFTSIFTSITPGIGNSQAGILSSIFFRKKIEGKDFITTISAINTSSFIFSIITFYVIEKSRNGSIVVLSKIVEEINSHDLLFYFTFLFFLIFFLYKYTLFLGKIILKRIHKFNFKKINFFILTFIILLVFYFDNFFGILILFTATFLGLLTIKLEIKKIHLMSVLIIPIIINFLI